MATGVVTWSQTAATNATADSNINWAEGMAPSQVNDSARAMMASVAKWRDDHTGFLVGTSGTATAFTLTTNQGFASLSALHGQTLTISFSLTNGANPTLSVDGLAAKPITLGDAGSAIPAGFIQAGCLITLVYDNNVGNFYPQTLTAVNFLPPGMLSPYAGSSAPAGWLLCDGTGYSRTTFATLFAAISTTYGSSDGSSFKVPNLIGKVPVGLDTGSTVITGATTLGTTLGEQLHILTTGELPASPPTGTISGTQNLGTVVTTSGGQNVGSASPPTINTSGSNLTVNGSNFSFTGNNLGSGTGHNTMQPSIALNYIIKT